MDPSALAVPGSYDYHLVVLSVVISIIAAYAALNLGGRVTTAHGGRRLLFLSGGTLAMGIGIWSSVSALGTTGVVSATLMVLGLILLTSMADRRISQEATERQQAVTALIDSERTYGLTFEAAPFGIAHVSLDGRWLRVNQRLCDLLGYTAEQLKATDLLALTHPDDVKKNAEVRRQLRAGLIDRHALIKRYRCGDGRFIWASVTINLIRDAAGQPAHLLTTIEDVTERRNLEDQFRQKQKMEAIGQLAAGVAHDFNNLLTVIVGFSELTMDRLEPDHPARTDLLQVLYAGRSASLLTSQLLAFSRRQILQPQILDLNAVMDRMEMLLRRTIGEEVALVFRLAPSLGRVSADPGQIEQVVMNLAVNARDAMPGGGVITIETGNVDLDEKFVETHHGASLGRHVRIGISDTGVGIADSVRAHLFEPFFTTKERGKGTGLGLATVYGIVKQSGGSIWVDSEVGHGSTFNLYLPRAEQVDDPRRPSPEAMLLGGGTETILVAEDQREVGSIMREILVRHGYTVLDADGGEDALRLAREHTGTIDLLLTDVVMPGMTGRDLARLLFQQRPRVRVLYTSGYTDHAIVQHGVIEPGLAFIQKPFSTEALLRKVRDTLDKVEASSRPL